LSRSLTNRPASQRIHRDACPAGRSIGIAQHRARATFLTEALDRKCPTEAMQASVDYRPTATTKQYDPHKLHDWESASFAVRY